MGWIQTLHGGVNNPTDRNTPRAEAPSLWYMASCEFDNPLGLPKNYVLNFYKTQQLVLWTTFESKSLHNDLKTSQVFLISHTHV